MDLCRFVPKGIRTRIEGFQAAAAARDELSRSSQELARKLRDNNLTMGPVDFSKLMQEIAEQTTDEYVPSVSPEESARILKSLGFSPDGKRLPKD